MTASSSFLFLPAELFVHISQYADATTRARLMQACRSLRDVVQPVHWAHLRIGIDAALETLIQVLTTNPFPLRHVRRVSFAEEADDLYTCGFDAFIALIGRTAHAAVLAWSLPGSWALGSHEIRALAHHLGASVRILDVSRNPYIGNADLAPLIECSILEDLDVSGIYGITDECLLHLAKHCMHTLRSLRCATDYRVTAHGVATVLRACTMLTYLDASLCNTDFGPAKDVRYLASYPRARASSLTLLLNAHPGPFGPSSDLIDDYSVFVGDSALNSMGLPPLGYGEAFVEGVYSSDEDDMD